MITILQSWRWRLFICCQQPTLNSPIFIFKAITWRLEEHVVKFSNLAGEKSMYVFRTFIVKLVNVQ